MLYTNIPYAPDKSRNLGMAYNRFMALLEDEDWACFIDHDAMFTTLNWYDQISDIIRLYPDAGIFSAMTNRIGNKPQLYQKKKSDNHDMRHHREIGKQLQAEFYDTVKAVDEAHPLSGVVMVIKRAVWREQNGFKDGFLGVDNDFCLRVMSAGRKAYVMKGVYVYHWYRADGVKDHLNLRPSRRKENGGGG